MEGGFLLDVVILECTAILKLLTGKDQALLVGRDALFVLDLSFDVLDRVGLLHIEGDSLSGKGLHEDLHSTT